MLKKEQKEQFNRLEDCFKNKDLNFPSRYFQIKLEQMKLEK